MYSTKRTSLSK